MNGTKKTKTLKVVKWFSMAGWIALIFFGKLKKESM